MSVLDMPNFLYIMTLIVITATYGNPSAKYNEGIHDHAFFLFSISFNTFFPPLPLYNSAAKYLYI